MNYDDLFKAMKPTYLFNRIMVIRAKEYHMACGLASILGMSEAMLNNLDRIKIQIENSEVRLGSEGILYALFVSSSSKREMPQGWSNCHLLTFLKMEHPSTKVDLDGTFVFTQLEDAELGLNFVCELGKQLQNKIASELGNQAHEIQF